MRESFGSLFPSPVMADRRRDGRLGTVPGAAAVADRPRPGTRIT